MDKTTVYLTAEQKAALTEAARAVGSSEARLIRDGITAVVAGHRAREAVMPLAGASSDAPGAAVMAPGEGPAGPSKDRPRWISRDEFVRRFVARQSDPALAAELRDLAPDTTDDLPAP